MPDRPIETREEYLQAVANGLPFEDAERSDILRELSAHLADSMERLRADGMTADEAERHAIERLGPPGALADDLTQARRTPRRLLAAAGAGVFAVVRGGLWGALWGLLAVLAGAVVVGSMAQSLATLLRIPWGNIDATTSGLVDMPLPIAAFCAGCAVTPAIAVRAGYRLRAARRVAVLGSVVVAAYAIWGWSGTVTWPSAMVVLAMPFAWVAGAWRAKPFRAAWKQTALAGSVLAALVLSLAFVIGPTIEDGGSIAPFAAGSVDQGFDRIAAPIPADVLAAAPGDVAASWVPGSTSIEVPFSASAVLDGWRDLRIEAWAATQASTGPATVRASARGPFATAALTWNGAVAGFAPRAAGVGPGAQPPVLTGTIALNREPGVDWAIVALTGIAPDGRRHLLAWPIVEQAQFSGTVWDWFASIAAGA